jgi:hypothetical protein
LMVLARKRWLRLASSSLRSSSMPEQATKKFFLKGYLCSRSEWQSPCGAGAGRAAACAPVCSGVPGVSIRPCSLGQDASSWRCQTASAVCTASKLGSPKGPVPCSHKQ